MFKGWWSKRRNVRSVGLWGIVLLSFLAAYLFWSGPVLAQGPQEGQVSTSTGQLSRTLDCVVVEGSEMPAFQGVPLEQLFVYVYQGGAWKQIPWQFDEVANGHSVAVEDGALDEDDQLVFMAADVGDQAPPGAWIAEADSHNYSRYEVVVADPLAPGERGWVYVYRSQTAQDVVATDYVDYDPAHWIFTTDTYLMRVIPYRISVDRLELNGSGIDILDRTKFRLYVPELSTLLTENLVELADTPIVRDGKVRAFATLHEGSSELTLTGYRSRYELFFDMDFSSFVSTFSWMRLSADLSPEAEGSIYYDRNTAAGAVVDGENDAVATSPLTDWWQVSGNTGTVIQIAELPSGEARNYYKDDKTVDPADTGDKRSYSDCGTYIEHPSPHLVFRLWYYVLPANQGNVGATYRDYAKNPLQVEANEQHSSGIPWLVYLPFVK